MKLDLDALEERAKVAMARIQAGHAPMRIPAEEADPDLVLGEIPALVGRIRALEKAARATLDECFCDDRDGNCNPPHAPECARCVRLRAALDGNHD